MREIEHRRVFAEIFITIILFEGSKRYVENRFDKDALLSKKRRILRIHKKRIAISNNFGQAISQYLILQKE